jgi:hypothetical protein
MKSKILSCVAREIHRLTKDDDLRQELWLYFFEGHSPFTFEKHLLNIIKKEQIHKDIISYVDMESINGIKKKL